MIKRETPGKGSSSIQNNYDEGKYRNTTSIYAGGDDDDDADEDGDEDSDEDDEDEDEGDEDEDEE